MKTVSEIIKEEGFEEVSLFDGIGDVDAETTERPSRDYGIDYSKVVGLRVKSKEDVEDIISRLSYLKGFVQSPSYDDWKDLPWRVLSYLAVHHGIETLAAVVNAVIAAYGKERVLSMTDIRGVLEEYDILRDWSNV